MTREGRPTPAQRRVMENLEAGRPVYFGCTTNSQWGGLSGTIVALHRRRWIDDRGEELTEAGRKALDLSRCP